MRLAPFPNERRTVATRSAAGHAYATVYTLMHELPYNLRRRGTLRSAEFDHLSYVRFYGNDYAVWETKERVLTQQIVNVCGNASCGFGDLAASNYSSRARRSSYILLYCIVSSIRVHTLLQCSNAAGSGVSPRSSFFFIFLFLSYIVAPIFNYP
jgi:hypothetical protein